MTAEELKSRGFDDELKYSASRSSGAGGQNVNKVNTKVELRFHVMDSQLLSDDEKALLLSKLATQVSNEGYLILVAQTERSQLKNKEVVSEKFYQLLSKALTKRKKRKNTSPTAASKEKRLGSKRKLSEKKELRKKLE
jgi:ribosome-associated protein